MIDIRTLDDLSLLRESVDLECKLAAGRDGKGAVPAGQHWRAPALFERSEPYNQTLLELWMVDLLSEHLLGDLRRRFGAAFDGLERNERLTMAAAASERTVTHGRVIEMTGLHSFDATRLLQNLVWQGFLESHNPGRGAVYCMPGAALPKPEEVFGDDSPFVRSRSEHLIGSSEQSANRKATIDSGKSKEKQRDNSGRLLSDQLDAPVVDALDALLPDYLASLQHLAVEPKARGKLPPDVMRRVILALCAGQYVTGTCLAALVDRDAAALRQQHLKPLLREGKLRLAFPTAPTHAMQAYRATED